MSCDLPLVPVYHICPDCRLEAATGLDGYGNKGICPQCLREKISRIYAELPPHLPFGLKSKSGHIPADVGFSIHYLFRSLVARKRNYYDR